MLDLDSLRETNDRKTAESRVAHYKNLLVLAVRRNKWAKATQLVDEIGQYERFLDGTLKRFPGKNRPARRRDPRSSAKLPTRLCRARKTARRDNSVPSWSR